MSETTSRLEEPVTWKGLLATLGGALTVVLMICGGVLLRSESASAQATEQMEKRAAKVEAAQKETDAGVGKRIADLDKKFTAKFEKQDTKMNCLIDKRWCPAARELMDAEP